MRFAFEEFLCAKTENLIRLCKALNVPVSVTDSHANIAAIAYLAFHAPVVKTPAQRKEYEACWENWDQ